MHKFPSFLLVLAILFGCDDTPEKKPLTLEKSSFEAFDGWNNDDIGATIPALLKSCKRIEKRPDERMFGVLPDAGTYADWKPVCQAVKNVPHDNHHAAKSFFEQYFTPYQVRAGDEAEGLFTGYYEAHLRGSLVKQGPYQTPLYARPDDLVMVNLGEFRPSLKGNRIAGRVQNGRLRPYEDRAEIVAGDWPHNDQVLVWVDSPVDAFFVQIQGSGIIEMVDGLTMRIGYAGQNGHPYYAIGRELIKREALTKDTVSMQSIRAWLEENPNDAEEVMSTNASYVFFRKLDGEGPLGGEGVALTAGRSLAVDRTQIPYGAPLWLEADPALEGEQPLRRLMIAQDTGGAIRGPVRGDVFWGYGADAETKAGHMNAKGRYWILLPNTLYVNYEEN